MSDKWKYIGYGALSMLIVGILIGLLDQYKYLDPILDALGIP